MPVKRPLLLASELFAAAKAKLEHLCFALVALNGSEGKGEGPLYTSVQAL